ncbi:unnamed protein product, partial [Ectocarpus sp. 12 AP-2014]
PLSSFNKECLRRREDHDVTYTPHPPVTRLLALSWPRKVVAQQTSPACPALLRLAQQQQQQQQHQEPSLLLPGPPDISPALCTCFSWRAGSLLLCGVLTPLSLCV